MSLEAVVIVDERVVFQDLKYMTTLARRFVFKLSECRAEQVTEAERAGFPELLATIDYNVQSTAIILCPTCITVSYINT